MKVKRRNVCEKCRKRKLGCDGKRPGCSQCILSGLKCDGYAADWTFVEQSAPAHHSSKRGGQALIRMKNQGTLLSPDQQVQTCFAGPMIFQQHLNRPDMTHLSELIVQNFVPKGERAMLLCKSDYVEPRICGSWVEVLSYLPCLRTSTSVLSKAVTALAVSLLSRLKMGSFDCSQSYEAAIHMLRQSLGMNGSGVNFEHIPTIMCLTLVEHMIPDSTPAIAAHIRAVGLLFQAHGPDAYKDGILHRLLVGFRPLLIIQALQDRQPTFLASPAWIEVPFSSISPSLMQTLLTEVIMIPSLLQRIDLLLENPQQDDLSEIDELISLFLDCFARLHNWETTLGVEACQPNWRCGDMSHEAGANTSAHTYTRFHYPNVSMANIFTHIWAFQINCLTEIGRLATISSRLDRRQSTLPMPLYLNLGRNQECMTTLARQIYQSMDYLLQDEMKLFGPASTFYPLRVAYQSFKTNELGQIEDITFMEGIVDRLVKKGLLSARALVFDN